MKLPNIAIWLPRIISVMLTLVIYGFLFQFTPRDFEWPNFIYALIPGTALLLLTLLSWLFPKPGGILFALLGASYAIYSYNKVSIAAIAVFSGAAIITGILYFLQKKGKKEERPIAEKVKKEPVSAPAAEEIERVEEVIPGELEMEEESPEKEKEELLQLPPKIIPKNFETKEPPGAEIPPVRKAAESEQPLKKDKEPEISGTFPNVSLTTQGTSISGDDLDPKKNSDKEANSTNKKSNGPSEEFLKWIKRQNLK